MVSTNINAKCSVETMSLQFYTEEQIMLNKITTIIQKMIQPVSRQTELDQFITSKNPQSAAEVDHWAKVFTQTNGGRYGF